MKKLKKPLGMLIAVVLMVAVLVPVASARYVITPRVNGAQRATTVSMVNGQSSRVFAYVMARFPNSGGVLRGENEGMISTTTPWIDTTGANARSHGGRPI